MTTIREQVNPVGINDLSGRLALLFVHINANELFKKGVRHLKYYMKCLKA